MPSAKILLHLVAALTGVVLVWYVWMMMTETKLEILCLPLLVAWLVYYLMCVFWHARQPVVTVTGS